jgi:hypothetical protein
MNKRVVICFFLFSLIRSHLFAGGDTIRLNQERVKKQYYTQPLLLKSNPLATLWGPIPFTGEYRLMAEITTGRTRSAQAGISYLGKSLIYSIVEQATKTPSFYRLKVSGWRVQAAYRFYLISKRKYAPFGFYVSPGVSYSNARIAIGLERYYQQVYFDFRHFCSSVVVGVQVGRNAKITMDIFTGVGYKRNLVFYHINNSKVLPYDTEDFGDYYNWPVKYIFGINFGYSLY